MLLWTHSDEYLYLKDTVHTVVTKYIHVQYIFNLREEDSDKMPSPLIKVF